MGLAVLMVALDGRGKLPGWCSAGLPAASVAGLCALSLYSAPENFVFTFYHPVASLLWVVLLYSTLQAARRPCWHRLLHTRWLTGVGLVSYSLFIWHEPIMLQSHKVGLLPQGPERFPLALLIVLAVSIPVAVASYWFIEYPSSLLGRLKDPSGKPRDFYPEAPADRRPGRPPRPGTRPPRAPPRRTARERTEVRPGRRSRGENAGRSLRRGYSRRSR